MLVKPIAKGFSKFCPKNYPKSRRSKSTLEIAEVLFFKPLNPQGGLKEIEAEIEIEKRKFFYIPADFIF